MLFDVLLVGAVYALMGLVWAWIIVALALPVMLMVSLLHHGRNQRLAGRTR